MGFFNAITKLAVDVVQAPVALVKDTVTLGGVATDRRKSYTRELLEQIRDDADEFDN